VVTDMQHLGRSWSTSWRAKSYFPVRLSKPPPGNRRAREAEQAARTAELAARAQREAEEAEALLAAQSAEQALLLARDARYAARKPAKKGAPSR
jgi:hypothetical protein